MKQRPPALRIRTDEIVIDNFAGGGGASTGIDAVLAEMGRHVDIAINHDPEAIALHKANHPHTEHYVDDIFSVDIVRACRGRPVGLAWYSPDCTFHSKARGGKPFRERNPARRRRGLAWIIVKHAKELKAAGTPIRVIGMENVQEFADWGPLDEDGKPCPMRKGLTFRRWCKQLQNIGYELDMWELKGCDYGAPTTRERLFIVARLDGKAIVKPEPSHGRGLRPYRTAAECIDWSIPCPSIFNRKKPLAENTLRRIYEGIRRYVANDPNPFIVPVAHAGDSRANSIDEPLRTVTAERRGDFALVQPLVVGIDNKSNGGKDVWPATESLRTITTENRFAVATPFIAKYHSPKREGDHRIGGVEDPLPTQTTENRFALVEPFLVRTAHGERDRNGKKRGKGQHRASDPLPTQTGSNDFALAVPFMVPRYGEREGQDPRTRSVEKPLPTIVTTDNGAQLVAAYLAKQNGVDEKMVVGQDVHQPVHTITTQDQKAVVAATLTKHYSGNDVERSRRPDAPLGTVVANGAHHSVVTSHLLKFKGTSKAGQALSEPLHTIQAEGTHYAEVRAFLIKFYSEGGQWGSLKEPIGTITTKDRLGLVTIHGEDYVIVDIGLRMLTPRELFRAQGFPDDYQIAIPFDGKPLTKTAQVRMCGNSVCPPVAEAIVRAQFTEQQMEVAA